jgi:ubiquinone/menaquinone biosynthesis C-methylase UbiE
MNMFTKSAALYDAIYSFKDYQNETKILRKLIERHKQSDGTDLLDVACGTGAHLTFLRSHYRVVGLDLDPQMVEIASQKFPEIVFHEADMVDFTLDQQFDVVVCLFSSIGYLRTEDRLFAAAHNMARHLKTGGILAIEPWLTPEVFQPGTVHATNVDQPELKVARMNISQVEGDLSVFDFHYLVATPQGIEHFTERHELGLYSHDQYTQALEQAGLVVTHDPHGLSGRGLYLGVASTAE